MDIRGSLQRFEESLSSYTGDDPLDLWDRYVGFLERKLRIEDRSSISVVLDRLVQTFLPQKRYCNDIRYINLCIRCASYYKEPIDLYSYIHGEGVGSKAAPLYIAWAQQFEKQDLFPQADVVYQRAIENQAEPVDLVLHHYQQFQARFNQNQNRMPGAVRNPLQNSQLTNQLERQKDAHPNKDPQCVAQFPDDRTVRIISRSEMSAPSSGAPGAPAGQQSVSMYCVGDLVCEGSELCFEELRAQRYFDKCRKQKEYTEMEEKQRRVQREMEEVVWLQQELAELGAHTVAEGPLLQEASAEQGWSTDEWQSEIHQKPLRHVQSLDTSVMVEPRSELPATAHAHPEHLLAVAAADALCHRSSQPQPNQAHSVEDAGAQPESALYSGLFHHVAQMESTRPVLQASPAGSVQSLEASLAEPVVGRMLDIVGLSAEVCTWLPGLGGPAGVAQSQATGCLSSQLLLQQTHGEMAVSCSDVAEADEIQDLSQGGTGNLSHITPNTSLAGVHATPSRVQPSPTVNTREALDVIMDMFQAASFIHDGPFSVTSQQPAEDSCEATRRNTVMNASSLGRKPAVFAVFQDEIDKENGGAAVEVRKAQETRVLADIPVCRTAKQKDGTSCVESMADDSTVWGQHYNNSVAPCPNTTGDFALPAHLASTPFHTIVPHCWDTKQDQENGHHTVFCDSENKPYARQSKKLSPILEQSPSEEKDPMSGDGVCTAQGTIFPNQHTLTSSTLAEQLPVTLSFPEHTQGLTGVSIPQIPAQGPGSDWCIYKDSNPQPEPNWFLSKSLGHSVTSDLVLHRSPEHSPVSQWESSRTQEQASVSSLIPPTQVNVLDEILPKPVCFVLSNSIQAPMSDMGLSNRSDHAPELDISMSQEQSPLSDLVLLNSPGHASELDLPMSPEQTPLPDEGVPASPIPLMFGATELIADPWDEALIARLLSTLPSPLSSVHNFRSWNCKVPAIIPKTTISIGLECLHVDCIVGQGAFATVYQARDLTTSKKLILKVQKPANPWEFYINTQLNKRLPSNTRHLFNDLYSAHLFQNGSVLLGNLHNCGTLLNVVNLYKNTSDKVMPQPLAMYLAICILHMVEVLHSIHIIHADIKPDNFMLNDRFLENECFDWDHLDHGLVLIDLGQCVDMTLFSEGTAFTAKCLTSGFQCTEMLSGRPWNYQTDYFGIAGTVYCLIFGTYMKVINENGTWRTNAVFKRNPHGELWTEFFHALLNVPDCNSRLCLRSLQSRLNTELQRSYGSKLRMLKKRLVGLLLEGKRSRK